MRFCLELVLRTMVFATLPAVAVMGETSPPDTPAPRAVSVVRADSRTGRLTRSIVMKAKSGEASGAGVRTLVEEAAKNLDVSPMLVDSVIQVESNYNPY